MVTGKKKSKYVFFKDGMEKYAYSKTCMSFRINTNPGHILIEGFHDWKNSCLIPIIYVYIYFNFIA